MKTMKIKTFQEIFYEVTGKEENNLDETIEYRKNVTKFAKKVFDKWSSQISISDAAF